MRVATYNVLASSYVRTSYYPRVTPAHLRDDWRLPALSNRIAQIRADVICLQEVEANFYASLALPQHQGQYAAKGNGRPDGCATFVSHPLLSSRVHHYSDGSGHIALLSVIDVGIRIGIANTHLKWDADGNFALAQLTELCAQIDRTHAWVLCGDFNVTSESTAIALLRDAGFVDTFAEQNTPTCNPHDHAKRIDFIFAPPVLRAKALPHFAVADDTPLPCQQEPSDHVPIVAELLSERAPE